MATMISEPLHEIDNAAFSRVFDSAAQYFLNMSGEEFLRKWQGNEFPDPDSVPGVMEVFSLSPLNQA